MRKVYSDGRQAWAGNGQERTRHRSWKRGVEGIRSGKRAAAACTVPWLWTTPGRTIHPAHLRKEPMIFKTENMWTTRAWHLQFWADLL